MLPDLSSVAGTNIKYVIFNASGGAGHIYASQVKAAEYPPDETVIINVIEDDWLAFDWIHKRDSFQLLQYLPYLNSVLTQKFGQDKIEEWNNAQKTGDLDTLNKMINGQHLAHLVFGKNFTDRMKEVLDRYPNIKEVITTQPIGIPEMHKAIAKHNLHYRGHDEFIEFTVMMTDLPTKYAKHFLDPIREIDQRFLNLCRLKLIVPYPAVTNKNVESYHQAFAKLCPIYFKNSNVLKKNVSVTFNLGPIAPVFIETNKLIREKGAAFVKEEFKNQPIPIQFTPDAYCYFNYLPHIKDLLVDNDNATNNKLINKFIFIPPNAQVKSLMLGSQASVQGTLNIIDFEYLIEKNNNTNEPTYLFVFCGNDTKLNSLFSQVCERAKKYYNHGKFIIIPLTNQDKPMINHVYTIADLAIIRPGGLSVMELEAVSTGQVVIFAETNKKFTQQQLLNDPTLTLIIWEKGNTEDIITKLGDKRVKVLNIYSYLDQRLKQPQSENTSTVKNNSFFSFLGRKQFEQMRAWVSDYVYRK